MRRKTVKKRIQQPPPPVPHTETHCIKKCVSVRRLILSFQFYNIQILPSINGKKKSDRRNWRDMKCHQFCSEGLMSKGQTLSVKFRLTLDWSKEMSHKTWQRWVIYFQCILLEKRSSTYSWRKEMTRQIGLELLQFFRKLLPQDFIWRKYAAQEN